MPEGPREFINPKYGISVELSAVAMKTIQARALAAGEHETGGILIGRYNLDGNKVLVSEATTQTKDSWSGRTWFQRGIHGLKDLLRSRWSGGEYYVGEWHSHPSAAPEPSWKDITAMQKISRTRKYRCPKPIMVIAGTSGAREVSLSASVFSNGGLVRLHNYSSEPSPGLDLRG